MDGQDKQGVPLVETNRIVVNGGKNHSSRHRLHFKIFGIIASCMIILVVIVLGGFLFVNRHKKDSSSSISVKQSLPSDFSTFTPQEKAQYYVLENNYSDAHNIYKAQLETAKTADDKAKLYDLLAGVAMSAKQYSQAVAYEKQADTLVPTYITAKAIGYAAQMEGDKLTATKYYQLAISRVDKSLPNYDRIISQIQSSLNEVRQ